MIVKKSYGAVLLYFYIVLIVIVRCPRLLISPRFWAEEGQTYFTYAYNNTALDTIIAQFFGYYTFVPNVAVIIATLFPLSLAPFATTYAAFFVILIVLSIVVFGNSDYWNTYIKKIFVISLVLLISPEEAWLSTIHSMFWMSLFVFFILFENCDIYSNRFKLFTRSVLLVSGLNGVVSCFLVPAYCLKYYYTKSKETIIHIIILSICSLIQITIAISSILSHDAMMGSRFNPVGFDFVNILNLHFYRAFVVNYTHGINLNYLLGIDSSVTIISILWLAYFMYLIYVLRKNTDVKLMFVSFIVVSVLSTISSLNMMSAPRYVFLPSIICFMLLYTSAITRNNLTKVVSTSLIVAIFFMLAFVYKDRVIRYARDEWPIWSEEVKIWSANKAYAMKIWPINSSNWVVRLGEDGNYFQSNRDTETLLDGASQALNMHLSANTVNGLIGNGLSSYDIGSNVYVVKSNNSAVSVKGIRYFKGGRLSLEINVPIEMFFSEGKELKTIMSEMNKTKLCFDEAFNSTNTSEDDMLRKTNCASTVTRYDGLTTMSVYDITASHVRFYLGRSN